MGITALAEVCALLSTVIVNGVLGQYIVAITQSTDSRSACVACDGSSSSRQRSSLRISHSVNLQSSQTAHCVAHVSHRRDLNCLLFVAVIRLLSASSHHRHVTRVGGHQQTAGLLTVHQHFSLAGRKPIRHASSPVRHYKPKPDFDMIIIQLYFTNLVVTDRE